MSDIPTIQWQYKSFSQLTNDELYDLLQLRSEVFVVEQNCVYQDCDGKDKFSFHLSGYLEGKLVAYARLLPEGISYANATSIGRIVTSPAVRGKNIGKALVKQAVEGNYQLFGNADILMSAQAHLQEFYAAFGFASEGTVYEEDGIPHIQMRKSIINSPQ